MLYFRYFPACYRLGLRKWHRLNVFLHSLIPCVRPGGHSMLLSLKTLLLLSVLCAPTSSLCLRLYRSDLLCDDQMAVGVRRVEDELGYSPVDGLGSLLQSAEYLTSSSSSSSESSREKRTSSPANYRFTSRTKLRGQILRNSSNKGDRRSRLTLSLDVPTNIMNVLFDVAKAKNLRAKAAENARLLAQIGRRKWTRSVTNSFSLTRSQNSVDVVTHMLGITSYSLLKKRYGFVYAGAGMLFEIPLQVK